MFTVLLAGRFSSSCGTSMAMLLEKRQSNVLLFAADQKDQFFFHIFCAFCWLSLVSLKKKSQVFPAAARKTMEVRLVLRIRCFFSQKLHFTSSWSTYQLLPRFIHLMDSPPPTSNERYSHGTIDPFACVVIRATWWSFFGGSFWRVREIKQTT